MGISKKLPLDGCTEPDGKNWVIAGISSRASPKPNNAKPKPNDPEEEPRCTTPKSEGSRIPRKVPCPAAPLKRRPLSINNFQLNGGREFFIPPDLEIVFKFGVDRAN